MFIRRLNTAFFLITLFGSLFLGYIWYKDFQFIKKPLDLETQEKIIQKTVILHNLAYKNYNIKQKIPVLISNKMKSNLFGMTAYSTDKQIIIYLNKIRFKESVDYMIDSVLPHEYAHAVMFALGDFSRQNKGHTIRWQNICKTLGGKKCDRFVNTDDIVIDKTNPFK